MFTMMVSGRNLVKDFVERYVEVLSPLLHLLVIIQFNASFYFIFEFGYHLQMIKIICARRYKVFCMFWNFY